MADIFYEQNPDKVADGKTADAGGANAGEGGLPAAAEVQSMTTEQQAQQQALVQPAIASVSGKVQQMIVPQQPQQQKQQSLEGAPTIQPQVKQEVQQQQQQQQQPHQTQPAVTAATTPYTPSINFSGTNSTLQETQVRHLFRSGFAYLRDVHVCAPRIWIEQVRVVCTWENRSHATGAQHGHVHAGAVP